MYVRKVKKAGKTYLYYYKSQRTGNKVRSIYVGKVLEKPKKEVAKQVNVELKPEKNTSIVNNLLEFDNLLFEINRLISLKDIKNSINVYNKMLNLYSSLEIHPEDKQKIFNKLNNTYNELVNLTKEHNIELI